MLGLPAAQAKDRPFDRDWRTGVTVAPGASTWTDDNFEQKKGLINDVALARGKTCSSYAFLGWPPGSGGGAKILPETRRNYEAAGYTVTEGPGDLPSDAVWTVAKDGREAMILWSAFSGSIIYLSCITAGDPASDPSKPLYVGVLLALGLGDAGRRPLAGAARALARRSPQPVGRRRQGWSSRARWSLTGLRADANTKLR